MLDVIIGLDESGNGAIAGPIVVSAMAYLVTAAAPTATLVRPRSTVVVTPCDSKTVRDASERQVLAKACCDAALAHCTVAITSDEVDLLLVAGSLRKAAGEALRGCVDAVWQAAPGANITILVDGKLDLHFQPRPRCRVEYIVRGDASRWQVGAASLRARTVVDSHMADLARKYPAYGFGNHAGYATAGHLKLLRELGPCPAHRRTFRSIMEVVGIPSVLTEVA